MKFTRLFVMIALTALVSCSGDDGPSEPADTGAVTVAVRNDFFEPSTVSVPVNGTVTWQWDSDDLPHNVTFPTGPNSPPSQTTGTFARTFPTAGTFSYLCTIHGSLMSGVVNVAAGTGGTGTGGGGDDTGGGGGYP